MRRSVALVAALATMAACGGPSAYDDARACVEAGKVVVLADPTDQLPSTVIIGCVSVESVDDIYDAYDVEVSDD